MDDTCADCGTGTAVSWSPVFAALLCADCRASRTHAELGSTERANRAAALAGKEAGDGR
jgi:hypothetical protein